METTFLKQVSGAGVIIAYHIIQWEAITYTRPRYLLLAPKYTYITPYQICPGFMLWYVLFVRWHWGILRLLQGLVANSMEHVWIKWITRDVHQNNHYKHNKTVYVSYAYHHISCIENLQDSTINVRMTMISKILIYHAHGAHILLWGLLLYWLHRAKSYVVNMAGKYLFTRKYCWRFHKSIISILIISYRC